MATTTLHEYTHAPGVYSPGTDDNAYGYSASVALSSSKAVLNADSYALYANGMWFILLQPRYGSLIVFLALYVGC